MPTTLELPVLGHLLPEGVVGTTIAIEPIVTGQSGAQIYGVRTTRGELVFLLHCGPAPQRCGVARAVNVGASNAQERRRAASCI